MEQVPPLQLPTGWYTPEEQAAWPQDVVGKEQSGLDPPQKPAQVPVPPQGFPTRAVVVFVHFPRVAEQIVQLPVHALSQQKPSTQWLVEHSASVEQASP